MTEINGFEIENYNVYAIPTGAKTATCPKCSADRKKTKDKCLSVHWDTGLGVCNHCGETMQLHTYKKKQTEKIYFKPKIKQNNIDFSDKFVNYWCELRKIDLNALKDLKVREVKEYMPQTKKEENCIAFDYYFNNELINTKFRDAKKNFKLVKDAEKIFYNLDNILNSNSCIIVEGEADCLSFYTAGYKNCVSVPNGFNLQGNLNLDYIDNYYIYFETKEIIYIAVDNDSAGLRGQKELIRRFGAEKCKIVDFKDCKDANDFIIKYGKKELANTILSAKDVKIEGVFTVSDVEDSMFKGYLNGQKRGTTTGFQQIDNAWTWREGEVTLWTGYQNEGKSLMLNQLCLIRAINEGAKVGVFSPENMPLDDYFNDLIETYIGKSCDPFYQNNYMSESEYREGMEFVKKYFFLIYPDKDFKIDTIFEKAKYLVKKEGIRTFIIDPYNTVEHLMNGGEREDLYISRFMTKLKRFAIENDIGIHLVAHQVTARKNEKDEGRYFKPELNNIKGGGTFSDKADNVVFVWRPNRAIDFKDNEVIFGSQKIKKQKLVGYPQQIENITFNIRDNRYYINNYTPLTFYDMVRNGTDKIVQEFKDNNYQMPQISLQEAFPDLEEEDNGIPF